MGMDRPGDLEWLICNLSGALRRERLDGRDYLVAPLTMIVEGVLNGSKGRLFYPYAELEASVDAWNGMPIVLNHPADGSGRTPKVIGQTGVGTVFNAVAPNSKLLSEGWFDIEKFRRLDGRTLNSIQSGEGIELSTGLRVEVDQQSGEFNGRPYDGIARNHKPDHLAILVRDRGACSLDDGCGVNMNQEHTTQNQLPSEEADVSPEKAKKILEDGEIGGTPLTDKQKRFFGAIAGRTKNEEHEMADAQAETKSTHNEMVEHLVTNCGCDRKDLESLDEKALKMVMQVANAEVKQPEKPAEKKTTAKKKNDAAAPNTLEEWLVANNAPDELRELVENDKYIRQIIETERNDLINNIRENPHNQLTYEDLAGMNVELLRKLEASAPPTQAIKRSQNPPSYLASAVFNRQPVSKPKPLGLPEWEFTLDSSKN